MRKLLCTVLIGCLVSLTANAQVDPLQEAASVLGATDLLSIRISAAGKWFRFGQAATPSMGWPEYDLSSYTAAVDFEICASHVDMTRSEIKTERNRPLISQKVHEFVNGAYSWNIADGPQPTVQVRNLDHDGRVADIWATPQGFIKAAQRNNAKLKRMRDGIIVTFDQQGARFEGRINSNGDVATVRTWQPDPVLGDMEIIYTYSDYRDFSGLRFPSHILRTQGGFKVLDLNVSGVERNPKIDISIPESGLEVLPAPPANILQLAEGVYEIDGGDYNSVAIEQQNRIVVVEAPVDEARSLAVIAKIKSLIPGKPIKYVINSHAHFDHAGGLRTYVAFGATVVTADVNRVFFESAWKASRKLQPDKMSESGKRAKFESFVSKHVIPDAVRPVEIYPILASGHADGYVMVYLPAEKLLFEADAFTVPPEGARPPSQPNPYSVNLFQNISALHLEVRLLAPLHGRVGHMSDLLTAIGNAVPLEGAAACRPDALHC